jgi:hypothetical protein
VEINSNPVSIIRPENAGGFGRTLKQDCGVKLPSPAQRGLQKSLH